MINRVIWIVLDSVGMGELPDADRFGDVGSNTIGNVSAKVGGLKVPNMVKLGLGNIEGMKNIDRCESPKGVYARLAEISNGKDTTIGHWEMIGIYSPKAFPTYPNGFPDDVIKEFEKAIGREVLGNYPASGTVIIQDLGDEHIATGKPIVYTSADSVFQIAAHEDIISVEELYSMCQKARDILQGDHSVARVIARPFTGTSGNYTRTERRKDFSLPPIAPTILDYVKKQGKTVACVGKIEDIFCNRGITKSVHTHTNPEGIEQTIKYINEDFEGLIFTNLVDTDMLYGHRNDVKGFANSLQYFDDNLPRIMEAMNDDDILFITGDHGCDPTTPSTDHSREYTFLLMYGKNVKPQNLGIRKTFSDIAKTIAEYLGVKGKLDGENML